MSSNGKRMSLICKISSELPGVGVTEPRVAYMAVRRPDAKHRKRAYRRGPEVTAHPMQSTHKRPTARLWWATSN